MKLTNADRDAFVLAVMEDVPKIDYDELARNLILKTAADKLPKEVKAVWKNPELRGFVHCGTYYNLPSPLSSLRIPDVTFDRPEKLEEYANAAKEQKASINSLRDKVRGLIYGCTTLKQATERLPEFVKYLPRDRDGSKLINLPMTTDVVSELTKAGWPKGKKK